MGCRVCPLAIQPLLFRTGDGNASYGIIGLLTVLMDTGWKNAAAAGYALFLFATGIGHIVDMIQHGLPAFCTFFCAVALSNASWSTHALLITL